MRITKTRNYLELRVGIHHYAEILLQLRQDHFDWFNQGSANRMKEIQDQLSEVIISRHCGTYIEEYWNKRDPKRFPLVNHDMVVGEKNTKKRGNAKRKRGKKAAAVVVGQEQEEVKETKKEKDCYYAFAKSLTICYKTEDQEVYGSASATLVCKPSGTFSELQKLPKRFTLWVYPKGEDNPPTFYNPDTIPIAHLFRELPPEEKESKKKKKASKQRKN